MLKEWKWFSQKSKGLVAPGQDQGFSLIELMVVVGIIAILVLGVVGISRNPLVDVKGAIFNLRSDIAFARGEAAKRNTPVLVQFVLGATDGYVICVDDNDDDNCADADDTMLKTVNIDPIVQYFALATLPAGPFISPPYPNLALSGIANVWPAAGTAFDFDGVTFPEEDPTTDNQRNFINMLPDGSCDASGAIYLYAPDSDDTGSILRTPPLGVGITISGVMQIRRWDGSAWNSK